MLSCVVFNVRLGDVCTGFGFVGWGVVEVTVEKISSNEFIVTGNLISDRKFVITKPTDNYRVEIFRKRNCNGKPYFGRLLCERGSLKYFKTREKAEEFIKRQDFSAS